MPLTIREANLLNRMNKINNNAKLGTEVKELGEVVDSAGLATAVTTGAILTAVKVEPTASVAATGINAHKLYAVGDVTGNTAYGFGDVTKPTTGIMGSFGRTTIATGTQQDTGADFRVINKLVNAAANSILGCYVKAKNYSTGVIGAVTGLFVEAINDGGTAGNVIGIKIGSDGTVPTADVMLTNGLYLVALTTAITANSTATSSPAGSIGITSHATGVGKLFMSDGSKWQYALVA